jgi:hypothetical protein
MKATNWRDHPRGASSLVPLIAVGSVLMACGVVTD